ncbi:MAG: Nif3-like dinuclear metal center hexameric protein [Chloroflexi bacterium]|nr:MAG: Nif3-like dinuclear metal center hexameric protein [Chloroflexota bacterium]
MTEHVRLDDVVSFLNERLEVSKFDEEESNGLIVRASDVVTSIAAAVSTSFHAISRAKSAQADLLIVHHRSWPEIDLELVEEKHKRLRQNGISLYGAHSALDGASGISNGDGIAEATGVKVRERFLPYHGGMAGAIGTTTGTFQEFVDRLRSALGTIVEARQNSERFGVVAIASGGAPYTTFVQEAAARGADTYVTGEITMYTRMYAKERKINLVAGSHYSTETFGVRALAHLVESRFGIAWTFVPESPDVY